MKLLADVNVSPAVVQCLVDLGHEAVRATEFLDARTDDVTILALAREQGAMLLSRDQDFSALVALSGATRPSLINIRASVVEPGAVARRIDGALRQLAEELADGAIVTLDDAGARVHRLPITV